ncbi:type II toxin-antitoxin system Phd/YefM family antitoxin [Rhizobium sp. LCM 4573]|uniref:type II toxin-antitoxin system Phd/YefM family antitoxin n=1 Tax=Rhizobium sp. LCM 4573 TaxID=1848291 RepID=UPI0008DAE4AF|nr:type II toxin-antitoxin system Phd/YefM family antitoxin [Rhizobium sp. LCM 4573]OHV85074.1 prevent-host-death protein [Rhizobium sp. LCM 4573]
MKAKTVAAAEFKATCLRLIDEINEDGEPITITKRGKPVAVLAPVAEKAGEKKGIVGVMKGSVLRYDDPFAPAIDPSEWEALK